MQRVRELRALLAPRRELGAPLGVLALQPAARVLGMAQLRLEARYLRVGRVERALRGIHGITRAIVRGTRALHARFRAAQLGVLRFQLVGDAGNFLRMAVA